MYANLARKAEQKRSVHAGKYWLKASLVTTKPANQVWATLRAEFCFRWMPKYIEQAIKAQAQETQNAQKETQNDK